MRSKIVISVLLTLAISACIGCGGGSSNTGGGNQISVSVNPGAQQVPASGTVKYSAIVHNSSNQNVTWSVSGGGSIDASGNYTAPAAVPSQTTVTVTATAGADGKTSGTTTATLLPDSIAITSPTSQPTVRPSFQQNFVATVTNSAAKTVNFTALKGTFTPVVGTPYAATYTPPSGLTQGDTDTVTATLASDTKQTVTMNVTLLALTSLSIRPLGPALTVGGATGSQQLAVIGQFSDSSKYDWTPFSTWTSVDPTTVSVDPNKLGLVKGQQVGVTTIKASYGSVSTSTAVNVASMSPPMGNANLNGSYAFALTHAGLRGQGFATGSFTADGSGNITTGEVDFNAPQGGATKVPISAGSYTVYPDGRGTMTITSQGTDTFAFILANDGTPSTKGRFIVSDAGGVEVGSLESQHLPAASLTGNYAMLLGGMDGTCLFVTSGGVCDPKQPPFQNPIALAGQFSAASGTITNPTMDVNDNGNVNGGTGISAALSFLATTTAPDANGRGTLQVIPPSSVVITGAPTTWNFAYYVISRNKVLLIQTDQQTTSNPTYPALAGTAELQTFTTGIGGNSYVFLLERSASSGLFGSAGQWTFSSSNTTLSGMMDVNRVGSTVPYTLASGSAYSSAGATGRGTISLKTSPGGSSLNSAVYYLISTGKMYVLETETGGKSNGGVAEQQTTTSTMPAGILGFNMAQLATGGNDSSFGGQLTPTPSGGGTNVSGIVDSNIAPNCPLNATICLAAQANSVFTGSFGAPDGYGRGTGTLQLGQFGTKTPNAGYYIVSPNKMVVFGLNSQVTNFQAVDGVIEVQQ